MNASQPRSTRTPDTVRSLYIVLTEPASGMGRAIHAVTRDTYTHASLAFSPDLGEMYSFGRRFERIPIPGRIKREFLNRGLFGAARHLQGRVIRLPLPPDRYELVYRRTLEMYRDPAHHKYNYLGALGALFAVGTAPSDRFTCSEFVASMLVVGGAADFDRPLSLIRPQNLATLPGELVFEGDLKQYIPDGGTFTAAPPSKV